MISIELEKQNPCETWTSMLVNISKGIIAQLKKQLSLPKIIVSGQVALSVSTQDEQRENTGSE